MSANFTLRGSNEIVELVMAMIVAHDNFGNELQFKKEDVDNFIKEYKIAESNDLNEYAQILLWRKGYMSNERFAHLMDLEIDDNEFWIVKDDFEDLLSKKYETEAEILDGNAEWQHGEFYDVDVEPYFKDYTTETLQDIIDHCDRHGYEIEDEDGETILMTKENTKLIDKKIVINGSLKLVDILDQLDELKTCLNSAICEAQESADQGEVYNKLKRAFEKEVGEFKWKEMLEGDKKVNKLLVNPNIGWSDIQNELESWDDKYSFVEAKYGSLYHVLHEMEYFNFRVPDYDHIYGSIDDDTLNEYTQNRLSWD